RRSTRRSAGRSCGRCRTSSSRSGRTSCSTTRAGSRRTPRGGPASSTRPRGPGTRFRRRASRRCTRRAEDALRGADYVLKRVAFAIITVFIALVLNFVLFRLAPGNAITNLSRVPHATPETRLAIAKQFGLDKSKGEQFVIYLKQLAHGNMGISFENS